MKKEEGERVAKSVYNSSSAGKRRGSKRLLRTCYTVSSKKTSTPSQRQPPTFTEKHERVYARTLTNAAGLRAIPSFFFSFSLHRQRKKSSSRRQVCRLRSLINAVKQAQVTNWRVICIVIVTRAFAWRNREGAVPRGSFASLDLTENSGKERLRRVVPTLKRNTLL